MFRNLDVRDLELVRRLADAGSLTAVARQMHLSQPAVSQRLRRLQEQLGNELFRRRDGVMSLTAAGERMLSAAQAIADELDSAARDIRALDKRMQPQLRITTQCYTCYRWLPFVIRDMRALHPELALDVVPEATDQPYESLAADRVDLAIVSNAATA